MSTENKQDIEALRADVEYRKLKHEQKTLNRPGWLSGSSFFTMLSVLAAVVGIGGQHMASSNERALAQLEAQTAKLEQAEAEALHAAVQRSIQESSRQLAELKEQENEARKNLVAILEELEKAGANGGGAANARLASAKSRVKSEILKSNERVNAIEVIANTRQFHQLQPNLEVQLKAPMMRDAKLSPGMLKELQSGALQGDRLKNP